MSERHNLAAALKALECLDLAGQLDFIAAAAIETGGFYKPAEPGSTWDNQKTEFRAMGIFASDDDPAVAMRAWMMMATKAAAQFARVRQAIAILTGQGPVPADEMRAACTLIIDDGQEHNECIAAREVLKALDRAAA